MELEEMDKLEQCKELVKGLMDIMVFIGMAQKGSAMPVTTLCLFKAVLDKVYALLDEVI